MTALHKPVKRVTGAIVPEQGEPRNIVVTLYPPNVIGFRAAGRRKEMTLTLEACYIMAARAEAEVIRKERQAARKGAKR